MKTLSFIIYVYFKERVQVNFTSGQKGVSWRLKAFFFKTSTPGHILQVKSRQMYVWKKNDVWKKIVGVVIENLGYFLFIHNYLYDSYICSVIKSMRFLFLDLSLLVSINMSISFFLSTGPIHFFLVCLCLYVRHAFLTCI